MIFNTYIHPANPIKFVPTGYEPTDRYNTMPLDKDWFSNRLKSYNWMQVVDYAQPVQSKDRLSLQFWATPTTNVIMNLYRCTGELVDTFVFNVLPTPNNIEFNGGIYNAYDFVDNTFWDGLAEGRYYLYLFFTITDGIENYEKNYISEPIDVKAKHEGSLLLAYARPDNIGGLISQQNRKRFEKRIFAAFMPTEHGVERVSFLDNGYDTTQLQAVSFRKKTLMHGGNGGQFPDYELDCLMHVYDFPMVKVDGISHTVADGAALSLETHDNYPLYVASIELRESNNDDSYKNTTGKLIMMVNTGYPFVVMQSEVGIYNGIMDFFYSVAFYVTDIDSFEDYADVLNAQALIQGLDGTFSADANGLFYTLGDGETFSYAQSEQLTQFITINHTTIGASNDLNLDTSIFGQDSGSFFAQIKPDFGIENYGIATYTSPNNFTSHYVPTIAGNYTTRLFHDNTMRALSLEGDYLMSVGGNTPAQLESFILRNSPRITTFNLYGALSNSQNTLSNIQIINNIALTSITNYYFSAGIGDYHSLGQVIVMNFGGNAMTTATLNNLYNNIAGFPSSAASNGLITKYGVIMSTAGQTTGQQPNGSSGTARNVVLINGYSWLIFI